MPPLEAIAEFPIITYHEGFTGRTGIDEAFAKAGLIFDIAMSALDADVIKSYVELGMGVGIVAEMAFNAERDLNLRRLDCSHLFPANLTKIAVREGHLQRHFADHFIALCTQAASGI